MLQTKQTMSKSKNETKKENYKRNQQINVEVFTGRRIDGIFFIIKDPGNRLNSHQKYVYVLT